MRAVSDIEQGLGQCSNLLWLLLLISLFLPLQFPSVVKRVPRGGNRLCKGPETRRKRKSCNIQMSSDSTREGSRAWRYNRARVRIKVITPYRRFRSLGLQGKEMGSHGGFSASCECPLYPGSGDLGALLGGGAIPRGRKWLLFPGHCVGSLGETPWLLRLRIITQSLRNASPEGFICSLYKISGSYFAPNPSPRVQTQ